MNAPIPADATALATISWMTNEVENLARIVYLADTAQLCGADAYRPYLDDITAILATAFIQLAKRGNLDYVQAQTLKAKGAPIDCPAGWCSDGMNCYPCYYDPSNQKRTGDKTKLTFPRVRVSTSSGKKRKP